MQTKVEYRDERFTFTAAPVPASLRMGLRRLLSRDELLKADYDTPLERFFIAFTYADLTAATPNGELIIDGGPQSWPPTPEQFLELPETLVNAWMERVYLLNPSWKPPIVGDEQQEKKDD